MTPDHTIKASIFYNRPLVYIWKRESGEILYVGQSSRGLTRLAIHDVINKREPVLDTDIFEIFYTSEPLKLEATLIRLYKPKFNKVGVEKRTKIKVCVDCNLEFIPSGSYQVRCSLCIAKPLAPKKNNSCKENC